MKRYSHAAGLVLVSLTLATCIGKLGPRGAGPYQKDAPPEPREIVIPVSVETPRRADISAHFETTARVEAERKVDITSEGMGKCVDVLVEEGDFVNKGDILAELDKEEAEASLKTAKAQYNKQKADYERYRQGRNETGNTIISDLDFDSVRYGFEQSEANLEMQRVQLSNLTIKAPISGVITRRNIQEGMLVSTGTPVFGIVDPDSYILAINPPERELARLHEDQPARVTIDAVQDKEFEARVRRINPSIDSTSGTVKVTLEFDAETRKQLFDSAFARVRLVMETHENALLVPKDAVVEESARDYVYVVRAMTAEEAEDNGAVDSEEANLDSESDAGTGSVADRIEVETGFEDSDFVEIVSGIDDDALIVTVGQHTLKPGSRVKVTSAQAELAASGAKSAEQALKEAAAKREAGAVERKHERHP